MPMPVPVKPAPFVRLVVELGDANGNSKADVSGSLKIGPITVPLPALDVDFLDALGLIQRAFDSLRKR